MKRPSPTVSVILPFHNAEATLSSAVDSILTQTFPDFELLLVDDASTDQGAIIAAEIAGRDARVRLLTNEDNIGLAASLNAAIDSARGTFVARMDADDISLPQRLERQYRYLLDHPEVDLVGADIHLLGHGNAFWRFPTTDRSIKDMLFVKPSMWHPLYFFRRNRWCDSGIRYNESLTVAQDYDVLTQAAAALTMANIPEVLLDYRRHAGQASALRRDIRMVNTATIATRYAATRIPSATDGQLALHRVVVAETGIQTKIELDAALSWFEQVFDAARSNEPDAPMVSFAIARKAYVLCRRSTHLGLFAFKRYLSSRFMRHYNPGVLALGKFAALATIRNNQTRPVDLS